MNKWIWIGLILVVALGIYLYSSTTGVAPVSQPGLYGNAPINGAYVPTGNPDDVVNAYLQNAVDEQNAISAEINAATLNSDGSALDGLGKTYDETKL